MVDNHYNHNCLYSSAAEHHHRALITTDCAIPTEDGQAELTVYYTARECMAARQLQENQIKLLHKNCARIFLLQRTPK